MNVRLAMYDRLHTQPTRVADAAEVAELKPREKVVTDLMDRIRGTA